MGTWGGVGAWGRDEALVGVAIMTMGSLNDSCSLMHVLSKFPVLLFEVISNKTRIGISL